MKLTRDSAALWLPVIGAVVTYLLNTAPPTQWDYHQWLMAIAAIVAAVSTKLMTSGLAGKNDPPADGSIAPRTYPPAAMILLAVALGAGAVTSTGCAAKTTQPTVSPQVQHLNQAKKVLDAVRRVGLVVEQVQLEEQQLFLAGQVPAQIHADIQKAFNKTATAVLIASDTLAKAEATTDPAVVVQALADGLKDISASLAHLSPKQGAQLAGWIDTAAALIEVALS